jgi:hypothetical protein
MADNSIPTSYDPIVQLLEDAADGAHTHGAAIGLVHNDEAHIRTDLIALVGKPAGPGGVPPAVPGFKSLWNVAQTNKSAKTAALRTVQSNARLYVRTCIRSLFPVLGENWNASWNAAGFTGGSLAMPANPMTLLQQMRAYYVANPTRESVVQGINCNAATCEATAQGLSDAESASNQSNTDAGTAQANYQNGIAAARGRLSGLRDELDQLISDDDDRWYAFGFDKPSDPSTPEVPANLTAVAGAAGSKTVIAHWDDARRADTYRFRAVTKADGKEVANEIISDSQISFVLAKAAAGAVVVLTVTGRNSAGESPAGNAVEIAVP